MTSSTGSPIVPAPVDLASTAVDAVATVAEESFFAFFAPLDAAAFDRLAATEPGEWVEVSVRFSGGSAGVVGVAMPATLAISLLDALLGRAPGEDVTPADIDDLAGEFTNMVAGVWAGGSSTDGVVLEPPVVRRLPAVKAAKCAQERDAGAIGALDDRPVAVWMTSTAARSHR